MGTGTLNVAEDDKDGTNVKLMVYSASASISIEPNKLQ